MEYQLTCGDMSLVIDSLGAQLQSLRWQDHEYLWQGDPAYWPDRSPLLFPYVGRFTEGRYTLHGRSYPMKIHGFASGCEFQLAGHEGSNAGGDAPADGPAVCRSSGGNPTSLTGTSVTCFLSDTDETRAVYPYRFRLSVTYGIEGNTLSVTYRVHHLGDASASAGPGPDGADLMYFGIGGHPGFRVPLEEGLSFEDYHLIFSEVHTPMRVGHTDALLLSGVDAPYPLADGRMLPLEHRLFDEDAIVLRDAAHEVTLSSDKGRRSVTMRYPGLPYLGIWHAPRTDAPYVCIEPWTSLPSRDGIVEEFACKSDLIRLPAGQSYTTGWQVSLK